MAVTSHSLPPGRFDPAGELQALLSRPCAVSAPQVSLGARWVLASMATRAHGSRPVWPAGHSQQASRRRGSSSRCLSALHRRDGLHTIGGTIIHRQACHWLLIGGCASVAGVSQAFAAIRRPSLRASALGVAPPCALTDGPPGSAGGSQQPRHTSPPALSSQALPPVLRGRGGRLTAKNCMDRPFGAVGLANSELANSAGQIARPHSPPH